MRFEGDIDTRFVGETSYSLSLQPASLMATQWIVHECQRQTLRWYYFYLCHSRAVNPKNGLFIRSSMRKSPDSGVMYGLIAESRYYGRAFKLLEFFAGPFGE